MSELATEPLRIAGRIGPPDGPFEEFRDRMLAELEPVGAEEAYYALRTVKLMHRLERLEPDYDRADDPRERDRALKAERSVELSLLRTRAALRKLQDERRRHEKAEAKAQEKARVQEAKSASPAPPAPRPLPDDAGPYDGWQARLKVDPHEPTDGDRAFLRSSGLAVEHYLSLVADWWSPGELFCEGAHPELSANDLRAMLEWAVGHGDKDILERCGGPEVVKPGYDEADELGRRALFTFNPRGNRDAPAPEWAPGHVGIGNGQWVLPEDLEDDEDESAVGGL